MDVTLALTALFGLLVVVVGQPQDSGLSFPDDSGSEVGNRQEFRPQQFPQQQGNFQGFRPQQGNFQGFPQQQGNSQGFRPQQSNLQGFPQQGNTQGFTRPNQVTSSPRQTQRPTQRPTTTTAATDDGSTAATTRIPPRDPTNRIVYTLQNCNCPFTFQYNPVCGTDGQTYGNMGVIQCAMQCGSQVQVYLVGACGRNNG